MQPVQDITTRSSVTGAFVSHAHELYAALGDTERYYSLDSKMASDSFIYLSISSSNSVFPETGVENLLMWCDKCPLHNEIECMSVCWVNHRLGVIHAFVCLSITVIAQTILI